MNQEKIGKLIAKIRKEKNMTQKELADKLNVTDRAIGNWENGRRLPDYSIIKDLCNELGITINEFFAGEKIAEANFKEVADSNLLSALENSVFTLKDKIDFFKRKWQKEHFFELTILMIVIVFFIIYGFIKDNGLQYLFMIIGFISGIMENNKMMTYIEKNAYGKNSNVSIEEFRKSMSRLKDLQDTIKKFKSKKEAVAYLMKETGIAEEECSKAYDTAMKIDFKKINDK